MRKQLLILFVAVATLTGCSKDKDSLQMNQNEVKLKYDGTFDFKINGANDISWSSSDEFVGTISNDGKFKAIHIGETVITGKVNGAIVNAKVVVEPKVTEITEPLYGDGVTATKIMEYEKREFLTGTSSGSLGFKGGSKYENMIMYLFENSKLTGSVIGFTTSHSDASSKITDFIMERYEPYTKIDNTLFFKSKDGKTIIAFGIIESIGVSLSYIPNTSTKSLKAIASKSKELDGFTRSVVNKFDKQIKF